MYSNPGMQLRAKDKDFGGVSQTALTRSLFPSVTRATVVEQPTKFHAKVFFVMIEGTI